jgi:hypothetical protein
LAIQKAFLVNLAGRTRIHPGMIYTVSSNTSNNGMKLSEIWFYALIPARLRC